MLGKVWFTLKNFVSSIMGLCLAEIKVRHKGVGIAPKGQMNQNFDILKFSSILVKCV